MGDPREHARSLRKQLTDAERLLWSKLRGRRFAGFKFRRQVPLGRYIVDFACFDRRLVLELDGGQHAETEARKYDADRTARLVGEGFRVIRFWNHELLGDRDAVEEMTWQRLHEMPASTTVQPLTPDPSPTRGEGR